MFTDCPLEAANGNDDATEQLTAYEIQCINQIVTVSAIFQDERKLEIRGNVEDIVGALNLLEFYGKKLITFAKSIAAFSSLNSEDQLILIKEYFLEKMILRAAFNYNWEHDGYPQVGVSIGRANPVAMTTASHCRMNSVTKPNSSRSVFCTNRTRTPLTCSARLCNTSTWNWNRTPLSATS